MFQRGTKFFSKISSGGSLFIKKLVPGGTNFGGSIFTMTVPQLVNLLSGEKGGVEAGDDMPDEALAVTTRAQTRRNAEETILRE